MKITIVDVAFEFSSIMSTYANQCLEAVSDYNRGILKSPEELENALRVISDKLCEDMNKIVQEYQESKGE